MLTDKKIQAFHHASRIFETRGPAGFGDCADKFGEGIAAACLITFLRCSSGAADASPENLRNIPDDVRKILVVNHLVYDEAEQQRRQGILDHALHQAIEVVTAQREEALLAAAAAAVAPVQPEAIAIDLPNIDAFLRELVKTRENKKAEE